MSKLFISHSSQDKAKVERLMEFLVLGVGVTRQDIFCTSLKGTLPTGAPFMERIRAELQDCSKVICFITEEYLKSMTCLAEMGAAWCQNQKIIPLLVRPITFASLDRSPLNGMQMLQYEEPEDLLVLCEELKQGGLIREINMPELYRRLQEHTQAVHCTDSSQPDAQGYYEACVVELRNTPSTYRCYKLDRLLHLGEELLPDETHWIFYRAGMYEDLQVGDVIRFSVDATELRQFRDLKNARNIYPGHLVKLKGEVIGCH